MKSKTRATDSVKSQILLALRHVEAEEGLYLRNFYHLHEEDEREPVLADLQHLLAALTELVQEGRVLLDENGGEYIYSLSPSEMRSA